MSSAIVTPPMIVAVGMFVAAFTLSDTTRADGCDVRAAKVATAVGASVRTRSNSSIALHHPLVRGLRIDCDGPGPWRVAGGADGPGSLHPAMLVIAQTAGLALHTSPQAAASAIKACLRAASRQGGELSEATLAGLTVECTASHERVTMEVRQAVE